MLPRRLGFQSPILIANVVIDLVFLQNPTQPMWLWIRHLLTSKHQGTCLFHDTYVMGTTVEARNWECPRLSLSTQLSWKLGKARLSARKIRNHHYFQAEDTVKYEQTLAQRKEAIDHLRKI